MEEATVMAALSTLPPHHFSDLTNSMAALLRRQRRRIATVLSSPALFSLTLHHLHSLSLRQKSFLIARLLLSSLHLLAAHLQPTSASAPPPAAPLRDLDAALLLLLLCELRNHDPHALNTPLPNWRPAAAKYAAGTALTLSIAAASESEALIEFVEMVGKCRRFVGTMWGKEGGEAAAAVAAVVALPSVEVTGAGIECAICREEMREGRDVCELPCEHLFHWICILPWLRKTNTCPCCRRRLPTDDVIAEIDRLWEVVVETAASNFFGGCTQSDLMQDGA
ncbi:Ubiquitin--protein ligase [Bertholletia excelsa]